MPRSATARPPNVIRRIPVLPELSAGRAAAKRLNLWPESATRSLEVLDPALIETGDWRPRHELLISPFRELTPQNDEGDKRGAAMHSI
jgi:hypothetical protein